MALEVEDFAAFHEAVHGVPPFRWQTRLLRQVVADRAWPAVLDLPTGSGKTTCIDIALFALALDAQGASTGWCPRRIAMVVDRRIVVDQVAERGRKLLQALLAEEAADVVREVAARLSGLSRRAAEPIGVFTLRGGMPRDDGWVRTPEQPLILASTVDQLGSRLLVQGYGVSDSMKPVHAGLIANDMLVLLDEVHLSQPFAETLAALQRLRARFTESSGLSSRFHYSFLSATPASSADSVFQLADEETAADSVLRQRLQVGKPASLVDVADRAALETMCVQEAERFLHTHDLVAVIVNRVGSATNIASNLQRLFPENSDIVLVTGRMRPLDRDDVLARLRPRVAAGRDRAAVARKLIVVGTQSLEAGADFDFDALVTEAASLDALRQRFGRVDRLGEYGRAQGVIIRDKSIKLDPVYEGSAVRTMAWLKEQLTSRMKEVDFGVSALALPSGNDLIDLLAPRPSAPVLLPAYMDLWLQTAPRPAACPDVSLWLHGPKSGPADVQIVWRSDLDEESLGDTELASAIVSAIAPCSLEAVGLPFVAARRWLSAQKASEIFDVEGRAADRQDDDRPSTRLALRWKGADNEVICVSEVRPGDTIVVPASRGGIRNGCFDPDAPEPVPDLAERAALFARGLPQLRLHPTVLAGLELSIPANDVDAAVDGLGHALEDRSLAGWRRVLVQSLFARRPVVVVVDGPSPWAVLQGGRVSRGVLRSLSDGDGTIEAGVVTTTEPDGSSFTGRPVTLASHCNNVEQMARAFASAAGFPHPLVEDVALAGWLHDIGKADRRFQILLRGGSEVEFYKDETLLAKSGMPLGARAEHLLAQQRSGYPRGVRHELLSVAMLENHPELLARATDPELVLHLLASHHGFCRPLAPAVLDDGDLEVSLAGHASENFGRVDFPATSVRHGLERVDRPVADRFWRSAGKYGWLELCWIEAVLRLADHRASEMQTTQEDA